MPEYNTALAKDYYTACLTTKLREVIADMIVNKKEVSKFLSVDFQTYDTVFMEVARDFNCDIDYIEQFHPLINLKRHFLRIKPSELFNHVRTKREAYTSDFDT